MKIIERNLQGIGQSLLVSLPKEWTRNLKLKKGSKIKMMISEQGLLTIAPEFTTETRKKEADIIFDENFRRKFLREYFEGNEKITIRQKKSDRDEIYSFLKRFMNVQIIEESEEKIVLKSFKIEDLSIEECLKRMYHLSINMLEEAGQKKSLDEMRDSMTRFYYMLVMQIRRFLEEGKFTKENQISLIRALDCRMVAEKMQRVSEIADSIEKTEIKEIIEYYSKSVLCFIDNNYQKALELWREQKNLQKKYKKNISESKNIKEYKKNEDLSQILRLSKEISMLVR